MYDAKNGLYVYVYFTMQTQGPIFLFPFSPLEFLFGLCCSAPPPPPPALFLNVDAGVWKTFFGCTKCKIKLL